MNENAHFASFLKIAIKNAVQRSVWLIKNILLFKT